MPARCSRHAGIFVLVNKTALDHDHGFSLDEFHINQKSKKGKMATVGFIADKAGTSHSAARTSVD
jgi:hypothetical protein